MNRRVRTALLASVSLLGLADAVYAQAPSAENTTTTPLTQDVIVTAPRQEVLARRKEEVSPNIINVQPAEAILKYPDFNAAEALGRIPGVSLSSDTGEGRFVNIRGIDANLNGATYGGVVLLNTNAGGTAAGGGGRAVEFDTIPTGAIDGIVVTKTRLPDQEGEGLGGTIELTPRSAAHINEPFLEGTLGWGLEPLHDHTGPFDAELAGGARFGFDSQGLVVQNGRPVSSVGSGFFSNPTPFSFVLNVSRRDDRRGIDDLEESYIDATVPPNNNQIHQYDLRRYDYHRRRFGYGGEFDFQPNNDHSYFLRASIAGYTEAAHKNFLLLTNLDGGENATGTVDQSPTNPNVFLSTTTPKSTLTDEQETHRNQIYVAGGRDRFDDLLIDYRAAYSRATFLQGYSRSATFSGPSGVPIAYDNLTNAKYPAFTFLTDATHPVAFNVNDPSQYTLTGLNNQAEYDVDEERSYAANAQKPLHIAGLDDAAQVGVEVRLRDKTVDPILFSGITVPADSEEGLSGPQNIFYQGQYSNGPYINRYAIRGIYNAETGITSTTDPNGFFRAKEDIYAGYAQYSANIGKANILAGVRVEDTEAKYSAFVAVDDAVPTLASRSASYLNAFPTVQLKYEFTPQLVGRAIYSTGVARPGFEQNKETASVDTTTDPGTVLITRGNPDLKPTTGNSFDVSLDYYLPAGGVVEAGVFDKQFDNYIVPRVEHGVTTDPLAPGQLADVTTFLNVSSAYARGLEIAYHQKFSFLIHPFQGLGVDANYTVVNSRILEYDAATSASGLNQYGLLPGTSRVTYNIAAFYEAYGLQLRLATQYVGPSLFSEGGDRSLDTIQDKRLTMDLTSSYQLDRHLQLYFNAKNLLNTPLRYYEGSSDRPIQREYYDVTLEGGVRFKF